jgi:hypothetical protein
VPRPLAARKRHVCISAPSALVLSMVVDATVAGSVRPVGDVASGAERTGRHVVASNARCVFSGAEMPCTSLLLPSLRFGLEHGG